MRETLLELIRSHPFRPFFVGMSNGRSFEVGHPEMAALAKSNLIVARPDSDRLDYCALLHIANVEANDSASPAS